jgi:hypothetical protein
MWVLVDKINYNYLFQIPSQTIVQWVLVAKRTATVAHTASQTVQAWVLVAKRNAQLARGVTQTINKWVLVAKKSATARTLFIPPAEAEKFPWGPVAIGAAGVAVVGLSIWAGSSAKAASGGGKSK